MGYLAMNRPPRPPPVRPADPPVSPARTLQIAEKSAPPPPVQAIQSSEALTLHFAAATIAEPSFPSEELLPRLDPIPYNNVGHMPLLDYPLLCEVLWGCAADLRRTYVAEKPRFRLSAVGVAALTLVVGGLVVSGALMLGVVTVVSPLVALGTYLFVRARQKKLAPKKYDQLSAFGISAAAVFAWDFALGAIFRIVGMRNITYVIPILGFALAGVASAYVYGYLIRRWTRKRMRRVKVKYIAALLEHQKPAVADDAARLLVPSAQVGVGRGILDPAEVQVFVAHEPTILLPGLGPVRVNETYVCPPNGADTAAEAPSSDLRALARELEANVAAAAAALPERGVQCVTSHGPLVVLDANNLRNNSQWLAEERPHLNLTRKGDLDNLLALPSVDADAKARVFFGLQVYFPEYATLVTLATRVFFAATSASVQILVASLGPPRMPRRALRERIAWHEHTARPIDRAGERKRRKSEAKRVLEYGRSTLAARLSGVREKTLDGQGWDPLGELGDMEAIKGLFARAERLADERSQAEWLASTSNHWVGTATRLANWREARSLPMSNEFFDANECIASVRALYAGLVEVTLASLERSGYNVDAYRDANGKLTIKTENIGQMIIGDHVQVTQGAKSDAPTKEPATAATSVTQAA